MICSCPYCVNDLPDKLKNGVIFCPNCLRVIKSDRFTELIAAFKYCKKTNSTNWKQIQFALELNDADLEIIKNSIEEDDLTYSEFESKIKKLLCE